MAAVDPYHRNGIPPTPTKRRDQFQQLLATKVEQGYDIESQGDTEAVITTPAATAASAPRRSGNASGPRSTSRAA
jgi:hypothetical protein